MPIYRCSVCEKDFKRKCDMDSHKNRKYPCKSVLVFEISNNIVVIKQDASHTEERPPKILTSAPKIEINEAIEEPPIKLNIKEPKKSNDKVVKPMIQITN